MDTTKIGAISGTIGALASIIPGVLTRRVFKITKVSFLDYSSVLIVGHKATDIWHWIMAAIGHFVFGATLGVIFAFFIKKTTDNSLIFKGGGFGALVWLITLALGSFFKLPEFKITDPSDCFWILIDALVFGVCLAFSYTWLSRRVHS